MVVMQVMMQGLQPQTGAAADRGSPVLDNGLTDLPLGEPTATFTVSVLELLNSYAHIFVIAFAVTLFATPIVRRIAVACNVIDHPDQKRKLHEDPIAYLGGVAVFLGLIAAIAVSYVFVPESVDLLKRVPLAIVVGMVAIAFTGLADDLWNTDPRLKIAGQLVAAAALAVEDVGVRVADGLLTPLLGPPSEPLLILGDLIIPNGSLYYWVGTAIIAIFVLGGANAANFLDGLDGLLSGVVATVAVGLLVVSIFMAVQLSPELVAEHGSLAAARIVLCLALLGAVLGFLPHNFNPATIFLGDCGSLLLGYTCVVIILMLGELGQTHLVAAGLIIFALPIMDAMLAIIRRVLAKVPLSTADSHHIHHQVRRMTGSVRLAVLSLYGISMLFVALGVTLAALVMFTELQVRVVYAIAFVLFSFIGVIAVKAARRQQLRVAVQKKVQRPSAPPAIKSTAKTSTPARTTPAAVSNQVEGGQ